MSNHLKVAVVAKIETLLDRGWSHRRIARELGIDRGTVARHARRIRVSPGASKAAGAPPGSEADFPTSYDSDWAPKAATEAPPGSPACEKSRPPNQTSQCEPFRALILNKLELGLSAQRIYQDLVAEHGFAAKYHSVRRFVQHLRGRRTLPFRRMECAAGEEAQIDFGKGAPVITPEGRRRRTHVLRVVLSHSRKGYSESTFRQTTDDFIRCLENAFHHFGGVPKTLVPDNLKAAVTKADWFDPELNPKIQSFCEHYGTVMLPTRPATPRHKGKVERGVAYAQDNGLKGKQFSSLQEQNEYLLNWETHVADTRIHGTTRLQVRKAFEEVERAALLPLPLERFPIFHEGRRVVHRDGHIEVDKAYYSVPPELLGREVWVRWDTRLVRIFNHRFEQIDVHAKCEAGRFSTHPQHIVAEKHCRVEEGAVRQLEKIKRIGPQAARWAEQMIQQRGVEGVRVLMGLQSLTKRHSAREIDRACETALSHGAFRLRTIRKLIKQQDAKQEQFEFIQEHPIIRSLTDYDELVQTSFSMEEYL